MLHLATEISTRTEKLIANSTSSTRRVGVVRSYGTYGRALLREVRPLLRDASIECVDITSTAHVLSAVRTLTHKHIPACDAVLDISVRGTACAARTATLLGVPLITTEYAEFEESTRNTLHIAHSDALHVALRELTITPYAHGETVHITTDSYGADTHLRVEIPQGGAVLTLDGTPHTDLREGEHVEVASATLRGVHTRSFEVGA